MTTTNVRSPFSRSVRDAVPQKGNSYLAELSQDMSGLYLSCSANACATTIATAVAVAVDFLRMIACRTDEYGENSFWGFKS